MGVLEDIKTSSDIKQLDTNQLVVLADEIRSQILSVTKNNGGHLSSNLGFVETTIAIHKVFNLPKDKLVFDVGHQCYAHKILSGRQGAFSTIRTNGGISGFPDIEESPFDSFSTGHAGTSISACLGMCEARDKLGEDYQVIGVVGDGSLSNGLNLEAITSKNFKPKNLIIILNDNGMSISKNKNGFYKMISKSTTKKSYRQSKRAVKRLFGNSFISKFLSGCLNFIKRVFNINNYFEQYGFKYVGIIDGNNIKEMTNILSRVKEVAKEKAVFLHIKTTKGKGYNQAEESSEMYHGVGKGHQLDSGSMSIALGEGLNEIIAQNNKVVAITAGMATGTGLYKVKEKHPNNFYDVGIAEEFAVTFASGMAIMGLKPVVAIYSTFLQRAFDQILHDVCMQNLPVVFCLDRAGFVGQDGKTHQGLFDLSYLSQMPNITILTPPNQEGLTQALNYALQLNSPVAIRYAKNGSNNNIDMVDYKKGYKVIKEGQDITVLAVGSKMIDLALQFASKSPKDVCVIAIFKVKPFDVQFVSSIKTDVLITLEENVLSGGFGSSIREAVDKNVKLITLGVNDKFVKHGDIDSQLQQCGLSVDNLLQITR